MESESSCTYKEIMEDYGSTYDSTLWLESTVPGASICHDLHDMTVPVAIVQDLKDVSDTGVQLLDSYSLEEMMMEPILTSYPYCTEYISRISGSHRSPILVCASSYGIKNVIFTIGNCLLCKKKDEIGIYLPRRFMKKVVKDCREMGVSCKLERGGRNDIYYRAYVSPNVTQVCKNVAEVSSFRKISSITTPVYEEGFRRQLTVTVTLSLYLYPNRRIIDGGEGGIITSRDDRYVTPVVLSISPQN